MPSTPQTCDACGKPPFGDNNGKLKACSRCHKVFYHGVECQREHFKKHKKICRQLAVEDTTGLKVVILDESGDAGEEDIGRVAIATRDLRPGEMVLCERPALVFGEQNGYFRLWDGFCDLPEGIREDILDMYHTPANLETGLAGLHGDLRQRLISNEIRRYYDSIPRGHWKRTIVDEKTLRDLISIVDHNAHSYAVKPLGSLVASPTLLRSGELSQRALYVIASKIEHSCAPNLSFGTTDLGMLAHRSEVPICKHERLSISYASRIYEKPKEERRAFLQANKGFHCRCTRCQGLDDCRPIWCRHCSKTNVGCCAFEDGDSSMWSCPACGCRFSSEGEEVRKQILEQSVLGKRLLCLKESLPTEGVDGETFVDALRLQGDIARKLPPLHHLHPAIWDIVSTVASSLARIMMKQHHSLSDPRVLAVLRMSALVQLRRIHWVERSVSIVHGVTTLSEAIAQMGLVESLPTQFSSVSPEQLEAVLVPLLALDNSLYASEAVMHIVFHAGQDLLLAGNSDMAVRLYKRYKAGFPRWTSLSDENRRKIAVLIDSEGGENQFGNHLLVA